MNMKMGQRERARERELFPLIHDKIERERERERERELLPLIHDKIKIQDNHR